MNVYITGEGNADAIDEWRHFYFYLFEGDDDGQVRQDDRRGV